MRTKALFLAVAATAAGIASVEAQSNVYSVNVVGYVNITIPANQYVLIANPLNATNNTLKAVIPNPPPGAQLQKFTGTQYEAYTFDDVDLAWLPNGDASFAPGEGGFFRSPTATTLTLVGEVSQGSLTNTLPIGLYAIRSSKVPVAGTATALGIPGEAGDTLQTYNPVGGYTAFTYDDVDLAWTPGEPSLAVGQAFFYRKSPTAVTNTWVRNFTVQ